MPRHLHLNRARSRLPPQSRATRPPTSNTMISASILAGDLDVFFSYLVTTANMPIAVPCVGHARSRVNFVPMTEAIAEVTDDESEQEESFVHKK